MGKSDQIGIAIAHRRLLLDQYLVNELAVKATT